MTESTVDHDGRRISYLVVGAGDVIVLLPPGGSSASAWRDVTKALNARFKIIAVNPSGYAGTAAFRGDEPMSLDDEARAVLAVVEEVRSPVHLVGHSYGGAIALRLALASPALFKSLTLIEPATYPILKEAGEDVLAAEVEGINLSFVERVRAGDPEAAFESYVDYYNDAADAWARLAMNARERMLTIADTVASALTAVHASPNQLQECAQLPIRTLLVCGSRTNRVHARLTALLATTIPDARLEIVDGAGHMSSLTHPEMIARLIVDHVGSS